MVDPVLSSARSLRAMMQQIDTDLSSTGLTRSPALFSSEAAPKSLVDRSYTLDLQSRDSGQYRNGMDEILRAEHTLTVALVSTIRPLDQWASMLDALDSEELVMQGMAKRSNMLASWVTTTRALSSAREYRIASLVFRLEMDWTWANT